MFSSTVCLFLTMQAFIREVHRKFLSQVLDSGARLEPIFRRDMGFPEDAKKGVLQSFKVLSCNAVEVVIKTCMGEVLTIILDCPVTHEGLGLVVGDILDFVQLRNQKDNEHIWLVAYDLVRSFDQQQPDVVRYTGKVSFDNFYNTPKEFRTYLHLYVSDTLSIVTYVPVSNVELMSVLRLMMTCRYLVNIEKSTFAMISGKEYVSG